MPSTLQNIMSALRAALIVPPDKVNYGYTDKKEPPYISVVDYEHTLTYDTSGPVLKDATFKVVVIDKSQDAAEDIAAQVDATINNNMSLTPQTIGSFQDSYKVGQTDPNGLYQFGVEIAYTLKEDPNK